ncbi:MAG: protoheme IX farnesyltransferase [Bacteriovoracaceae bacterium]|jgi:heme o synthase|nr:protoheme IX farnesyltransferase [Bacteriovoracaceae bacterium]
MVFKDLLQLTKPKLSGLVIFTSAAGMLLAPGEISFAQGAWATLLITMVVASGAVLNSFLEWKLDKKMARTKSRPLPAGRMSPELALWFGVLLSVISLPLLVFTVNTLTAFLGFIAWSTYLFAYTPMKKRTPLAVAVGAIPGALPPLMGWAACAGGLDAMAWSLFIILCVWQIPHFLAISIVHRLDYHNAGVMVLPNLEGIDVTAKCIFATTLLLYAVSFLPGFVSTTFAGYSVAALLLGAVLAFFSWKTCAHSSQTSQSFKWSKAYFWSTIAYLPLLFICMIAFKFSN